MCFLKNKQSKVIILLIATMFFITSCGLYGVRGSGRVTDEFRELDDFSKLDISGAYVVNIITGEKPGVKITAEDNLIRLIRTRVRGSRLIVDTRKSISPREDIILDITVPNLIYVETSGANSIFIENLDEDEFVLDFSGAGTVTLEGIVNMFKADISGAGSLKAKRLKAKRVYLDLSGASSANVYASKYLNVDVSGVGNVEYYGNPEKVVSDVSGLGSIENAEK